MKNTIVLALFIEFLLKNLVLFPKITIFAEF